MQTFNEIRYDKGLKLSEKKFEKRKWLFVLLITLGYDKDEAYRIAYMADYPFVDPDLQKGVETWEENRKKHINNANVLLRKPDVIDLGLKLRPFVNEHLKKLIVDKQAELGLVPRSEMEKILEEQNKLAMESGMYDLSDEEIKRLLGKTIKSLDNSDEASVKDLVAVLKMFMDRYLPPKKVIDEDDTSKVIIYAFDKKQGVCPNCNHEIDVLLTARFECPYCETMLDLRDEVKFIDIKPMKQTENN